MLKAISQSTLRPHTPRTQYSIERLLRARTEADRGDCDFLSSQQLTGMVLLSRERVHRLQSTVGRKVRRCSTIRTLPLKRYSTSILYVGVDSVSEVGDAAERWACTLGIAVHSQHAQVYSYSQGIRTESRHSAAPSEWGGFLVSCSLRAYAFVLPVSFAPPLLIVSSAVISSRSRSRRGVGAFAHTPAVDCATSTLLSCKVDRQMEFWIDSMNTMWLLWMCVHIMCSSRRPSAL